VGVAEGIDRLAGEGVEFVQVLYSELHGVCRGKEVPIEEIHHKVESGIGLTEAIMTIDLRHNVISGFEHGFRDIFLVPDLSRISRVPWDPATVWCMGDLMEGDGTHYAADVRHAVRRASEALAERGYRAIVAPELEFYLVDPDTYETYTPHLSSVYTVGSVSDPRGVFREIHRNARDLGLHPLGGAQEYGCGQFEINLAHGEALEAADRNLLFKTMVKQTAARHGLLATFMGRVRDDEGSGLHVHVSLMGEDGTNAFEDTSSPDGLSDAARQFGAGILAHTPALTAFFCPTVNAYRRMLIESLAPTHINWGLDNRLAMLRYPAPRGKATRLEMRLGDGSAAIHNAIASLLFAGIDGLDRKLELPPQCAKLPYEDEDTLGDPLPSSLTEALDALAADQYLSGQMGDRLIEIFQEIKRYELGRWEAELARVTDWERDEYAHHL
jgi:glutamine synthetase